MGLVEDNRLAACAGGNGGRRHPGSMGKSQRCAARVRHQGCHVRGSLEHDPEVAGPCPAGDDRHLHRRHRPGREEDCGKDVGMRKASAFAVLWGASLMMGQARPHVLDAEPDPAKAAQLLWTKVLTHCGDSYYLLAHSSDDWDLTEYKEPRLDFHADTLSLAD